jgi:hypothetical protein
MVEPLSTQGAEMLASSTAPEGAVKTSGNTVDPGTKIEAWLMLAKDIANKRPAPPTNRRNFLNIPISLHASRHSCAKRLREQSGETLRARHNHKG